MSNIKQKELKSKVYHIYKEKRLNNRVCIKYVLIDKIKIKCVGGENMTEENELVFLEPSQIPRLTKGKTGRNWNKLFDKIPKGKFLQLDAETYGSSANIRAKVKIYNEVAGKDVLKMTQRTNKATEIITAFVQRVV